MERCAHDRRVLVALTIFCSSGDPFDLKLQRVSIVFGYIVSIIASIDGLLARRGGRWVKVITQTVDGPCNIVSVSSINNLFVLLTHLNKCPRTVVSTIGCNGCSVTPGPLAA